MTTTSLTAGVIAAAFAIGAIAYYSVEQKSGCAEIAHDAMGQHFKAPANSIMIMNGECPSGVRWARR